jgi:hypothetical protein
MAAIKDLSRIQALWQRRASAAAPDYAEGVKSPRTSWSQAASAAAQSWQQGVQQAASRGAYAAGVRSAGDQRWQNMAVQKGPSRFAEGVQLGAPDYASGFTPYHQAISSLQLPPRGPAGSPQNLQRVAAVATALRQLKERTGGGGAR